MNPRAQGPEQSCQAHAGGFFETTAHSATERRVRGAAVEDAFGDAGSGADDDAERLIALRFELYAFSLWRALGTRISPRLNLCPCSSLVRACRTPPTSWRHVHPPCA